MNTYCCHVDAGHEVRAALYLRPVQTIQDLADVCSEGCEDLWLTASHAHEADRRLWVRIRFRGEDEVHCVGLRLPSGGYVVAITAGFAVVHTITVSVAFRYVIEGTYTIIVASNTILAVVCGWLSGEAARWAMLMMSSGGVGGSWNAAAHAHVPSRCLVKLGAT